MEEPQVYHQAVLFGSRWTVPDENGVDGNPEGSRMMVTRSPVELLLAASNSCNANVSQTTVIGSVLKSVMERATEGRLDWDTVAEVQTQVGVESAACSALRVCVV
ncbi:hypothetical protein FRC12_013259 [Ceratobasidium sp. 428]|nr:hypothetical protein FRC12_013259 [Ceratobasidium sp. 428]